MAKITHRDYDQLIHSFIYVQQRFVVDSESLSRILTVKTPLTSPQNLKLFLIEIPSRSDQHDSAATTAGCSLHEILQKGYLVTPGTNTTGTWGSGYLPCS